MATYDFEDNLIPSTFKNGDNKPWVTTSADANGGTYSIKAASITHLELSSFYILGDFAAGDFDCDYRVQSESNSDYGMIIVDGVEKVKVSGNGSWTSMTSVTLSAGVHLIQFFYVKDSNTNSLADTFYIDNIVVPTFTDLKDDAEDFTGGAVPASLWTNDATNAWESSSGYLSPFIGVRSKVSLADSATSTLIYDSPSDSPSGTYHWAGYADSESGFDFLKFYIDDVLKYTDSGSINGASRTPLGFSEAISSGTHEYKWIYSKDGGGSDGQDAGFLNMFYEPSMSDSGGPTTDQEAFRFYDDGTEGGATALEAQNTNLTIEKETVFQLRVGAQLVGDPSALSATLQYKKTGDADWVTV